jgi:hypothetical protein
MTSEDDGLPRFKCKPEDRNWALGEKCEACERGGQPCGPNERFERYNGRTPASIPEEPGFSQPLIHQASSPSNAASPELYPANFRPFGVHGQAGATPAAQLLDDRWSNAIDEVPQTDQRHEITQFLDEAGLHFDEPDGTLISSGAEIYPTRYGPQFITSSIYLRYCGCRSWWRLCPSSDSRLQFCVLKAEERMLSGGG